jgi:hypothetical protein
MLKFKDRLKDLSWVPVLALGLFLLVLFTQSSIQIQSQNLNNVICNNSATVNISTATTTRLVDNTANADSPTRIYVCSANLTVIGTATANTVKFQYGTGSTCGTGTADLSGPFTGAATAGVPLALVLNYPFKPVPVGNSLCAVTTQAGVVSGTVVYSIQ